MRTMFIAAAALIAAMASLSSARPALAAVGTVEEEIAKIAATISVRVSPGRIELNRTRDGPSSSAASCIR